MRRSIGLLRLAVTAVAIAIRVEAGYRVHLSLKHPNYFSKATIDDAAFMVLDSSIWQYDADYGWHYVPSLKVDATRVTAGRVVGCDEMAVVNEQGNPGPPTPDFDTAEVRIALFGDS